MPKIVDHQKQKVKLAEAAWRVIRKLGMEQASVRHIAQEAGMSVGSMRHYFASQSELMVFSMELVAERVGSRIRNMTFDGSAIEDIQRLLRQIIPYDENTRTEMEVWYIFTAKSLSDTSLQPLAHRVYDQLHQLVGMLMEHLQKSGLLRPDLDTDFEIERLYALVDGMAVHRILRPGRVDAPFMDRLIENHLHTICSSQALVALQDKKDVPT
ncbi:TetR/AcrR family transcriptional regulator [Paenibacillus terrae]